MNTKRYTGTWKTEPN